ncbi:MAG TPA: hypothetical protein EYG08_10625 [Myxococcales bacterium]|nr:hypothetical protein [Myxococcales bacterium]HIK85554.1 hypothetical protein [Myxococcales bacterium]
MDAIHDAVEPWIPDDGTGGGIRDCDGIGEDFLHPLIGSEGLAFFDPNGREQPARLWIEHPQRFVLNDFIEMFIERVVVGVNRVERLA